MIKTTPNWSNSKTLIKQLQRLWEQGELLRESIQPEELFPLRLTFKSPGSSALSVEFESIRRWLSEIEKLDGYRIEYKTIRHRLVGENSLPNQVWVDDLETAAKLLNKQAELAVFTRLHEMTEQKAPQLLAWIMQYPLKALALAADWPKLLDFVLWRKECPDEHIYLRQISLPGIDTKFIERHRSTLTALLDQILVPEQINITATGIKHFEKRYGFRCKPERIRFRLPPLKQSVLSGQNGDITLTAEDFSQLDKLRGFGDQINRVFITENEINFLSFPLPKGSMVIFGAGYGFDALAKADWLKDMEIYYWGDIDTHGFAILNQLRNKFPHVKSLLMDEKTLIDHQHFWGEEASQENRSLSQLSDQEMALYHKILNNHYAENLRLEQERINFEYLEEWLTRIIHEGGKEF